MTEPERDPDIDLSVEAKRARDLLQRLEVPRPDGGFRARLKETFVAGSFTEERGAPAPLEAEPADAPRRGGIGSMADDAPRRGGIGPIADDELDRTPHRPRAPRTAPPPRPAAPRRPIFRFPKPTRPRFTTVLAAAAAIAIAVGILGNRGAQWRVVQVVGTGLVQADGEPIPVERAELLAQRIHPGVELVLPETASLALAAGSDLAMEILPGTRLTIPPAPARWFLRKSELFARGGELRLTTGPTFQGAKLEVHTDDAMIQVKGTTLAVIMEPMGTCVCVLEGEVMVGARGVSAGPEGSGGDAMMPITSGQRGYVFRDGRMPERADIRPTELVALAKFRSLQSELLERLAH
ncbi:MAG TPA: FecR domain-containing protein [Candidatus Eisenbacteria bacterium]|nr:FecR domain-containing protein [Candidatus Eisenbacteria bacterium]